LLAMTTTTTMPPLLFEAEEIMVDCTELYNYPVRPGQRTKKKTEGLS